MVAKTLFCYVMCLLDFLNLSIVNVYMILFQKHTAEKKFCVMFFLTDIFIRRRS